MRIKRKKIKSAFTLAELMLAMVIVGFLAVCLMRTLQTNEYKEKQNILTVHKAIETINDAAGEIRQIETEVLPAGQFMTKIVGNSARNGNYSFAVLNASGNIANSSEVAALFGDYMKKDIQTGNNGIVDFCNATYASGACNDTDKDADIKGYKIPGSLYVGFKLYGNTSNKCPSPFYLPNKSGNPEKVTVVNNSTMFDGTLKTKQCWGELHIDTNGPDLPNEQATNSTENTDYWIFGLDEYGVVLSGI